jgi:hypothetical protein
MRNQTTTDTKNGAKLRRILIVDDEAFWVATMQIGLKKVLDCELVTAFSGEETLQWLASSDS